MILNRRLWLAAELTKKLNKILDIETKFVNIISSTNRWPNRKNELERMNQKLE